MQRHVRDSIDWYHSPTPKYLLQAPAAHNSLTHASVRESYSSNSCAQTMCCCAQSCYIHSALLKLPSAHNHNTRLTD
eukprot:15046-Heterococcus_DN1.PRE.1